MATLLNLSTELDCLLAPGLCCIVQAQAVVTFGLQSGSGSPLAQFTPATGSLSLFHLYTEANDIPAQREALLTLYNATAGQNWTEGVFHNTIFLEQTAYFINATRDIPGKSDASDTSIQHQAAALDWQMTQVWPAGTVDVTFPQFVNSMLLKVPWLTPGFSYCRWWGVQCCLTAYEASFASCSGGLQSIGVLALAGQLTHLCMIAKIRILVLRSSCNAPLCISSMSRQASECILIVRRWVDVHFGVHGCCCRQLCMHTA